ncbi:MAG: hypothetical protein MJ060_02880 [Clostridia bacterium]|nr:hypothetical protein [Clostridia bacterium]
MNEKKHKLNDEIMAVNVWHKLSEMLTANGETATGVVADKLHAYREDIRQTEACKELKAMLIGA